MSSENAGQVLFQIQELLRGSPLSSNESSLLAFQLLTWAHLSAQSVLAADSTIDAALVYGAAGIVESLTRLALNDGTVGQAFGDAPRRAQFAGDYIVSAATAAKRLAEAGIFERYSPAEVAAAPLQSSAEFFTVPGDVAQLMVRLTANDALRSVYCPWESSGQFVAALLDQHLRLYVETPYSTAMPALLSLFRTSSTEISLSDPLRSPSAIKGGHLEKFDASLSVPPWNMSVTDDAVMSDLYGRFPVKKATGNGLHVQHIVAQTEGKAAIIVPNSFLFGPGRDREVRENLLNNGWVQAVIALPAGLFSGTNLSATLLLLNTRANARDVGFVDATQPFFCKSLTKSRATLLNIDAIESFCNEADYKSAQANELDSTLVARSSVAEILANDASLQVDRYVLATEQRAMQAALSSMQVVTLDQVVNVLNPIPNKDRGVDSPSAIGVYEVGAVDLPSAGYIRTPERHIQVQLASRRTGNSDDVFLRPYDLVLVVKGSAGKIGILPGNVPPPGEGGWIAGQSAVVLRAKNGDIDLRGLGLWLRSKLGQQLLESIKSGATIPMMSIASLRRLKVIALIPKWTQLAIEVLEQEDELQYQIEALRDQQQSIAENLWTALLAGHEGTQKNEA